MTSDDPPDSASFDPPPESLEDDHDLPPALAPRRIKKTKPDERDTLVPPLSPSSYVTTMMKLGELDDPTSVSDPRARAALRAGVPQVRVPSPRPPAPGPVEPAPNLRSVRAESVHSDADPLSPTVPAPRVLAPEREMRLDRNERIERIERIERDAPRRDRTPPIFERPLADLRDTLRPEQSAPGERARAVVRADAPEERARTVPEAAPAQRPQPRARRSSPMIPALMQPRPAANLPVPRAPSVPPPPPGFEDYDDDDPTQIDGRDPLDELPFHSVLPPSSERGAPASPRSPTSRPPASGGLRLHRAPPSIPPNEHDRITPIAEGGALPWQAFESASIPPRVSEPPDSTLDRAYEMAALFEAKNYSSALVLAESVLVANPQHTEARSCAESCREILAQKYLSRLGGRSHVPRVAMPLDEIHKLSLDHRAGFLLSFIDGSMSIDEVLDVSSMPALDALRIMFDLKQQGAIEIAAPGRRPGRR